MKNYITTADIATEFGVSEVSVRTWIRTGGIRAIRLGRKYLVNRAELDRIRAEGIPITGHDGGVAVMGKGCGHVPA
jgi:excisionase family DNA binding protein